MRDNKVSQDALDKVLKCFSALGPHETKIDEAVKIYPCINWLNPIFSPIFLNQTSIRIETLYKIEKYLKKNATKSSYNSAPYFNILSRKSYKIPTTESKELKKIGWQESNSYCINLWNKPIPLMLPKAFHIRFGNYFDPQIYSLFESEMKKNFNFNDVFIKKFNKYMKLYSGNMTTVLIVDKKGNTAASGVIATQNSSSFLMSGSISEKHRGQNLWRSLIAARQLVSLNQGSKAWIMTTRNPLIMWKGEESYKANVFTKT